MFLRANCGRRQPAITASSPLSGAPSPEVSYYRCCGSTTTQVPEKEVNVSPKRCSLSITRVQTEAAARLRFRSSSEKASMHASADMRQRHFGRWPSQPPRSPKAVRIHEVSYFNERMPAILQRIAARKVAQPSFLSHSVAVQKSKGSRSPRDYIVTPRDNIPHRWNRWLFSRLPRMLRSFRTWLKYVARQPPPALMKARTRSSSD